MPFENIFEALAELLRINPSPFQNVPSEQRNVAKLQSKNRKASSIRPIERINTRIERPD